MLVYDEKPTPRTVDEVWRRLTRLANSITDLKVMEKLPDGSPIAITGGATGTLVPHGITKRVPRDVWARVAGDTAASVGLKVGAIDRRHVRIYATADAVVQLLVVI
jgi:hypothetical protein